MLRLWGTLIVARCGDGALAPVFKGWITSYKPPDVIVCPEFETRKLRIFLERKPQSFISYSWKSSRHCWSTLNVKFCSSGPHWQRLKSYVKEKKGKENR